MTLNELIYTKKTAFKAREAAEKAKAQLQEYMAEAMRRNYDRYVIEVAEASFYGATDTECASSLIETMRNDVTTYLIEKLFNPSNDRLAEYTTDENLYNAAITAFGGDLENTTDKEEIHFRNVFKIAFYDQYAEVKFNKTVI